MMSARRPKRSDSIPPFIANNALMPCCALHSAVSPINGTPAFDNCRSRNASEEFPSVKTDRMTKYFFSVDGRGLENEEGAYGAYGAWGAGVGAKGAAVSGTFNSVRTAKAPGMIVRAKSKRYSVGEKYRNTVASSGPTAAPAWSIAQ